MKTNRYLARISIFIIAICVFPLISCSKSLHDVFFVPDNAVIVQAKITDCLNNADAIVTIISDDGFYDSGTYLNSLIESHHLKATIAGAVCNVAPDRSSWKELLEAGNLEMVNHSVNHYRMEENSTYSKNYILLRYEIVDADRYFEKLTGTEQIVFVCPENQMCEKGYTILENNGFYAVRRGYRGFNSLSPEDGTEPGQWFNLCCMGIMDEGVDTVTRNSWIDYAVENHLWLIEMWHNVKPRDDGGYQTIEINQADEHLIYIENTTSDNEIWVATFSEAVKYIRERQNSEVKAYIIDNSLHIYVSLTNPEMSYETFNQPVTVEILLPTTNQIVYVNAVPGEETVLNIND